MNKEVKFSRFVGFAFILICVIVVVLALMSSIIRNENAHNIVYVEDSENTLLGMPKSNVVSEYTIEDKRIQVGKYFLNIKGKLPRVNLQTDTVKKMNAEIYSIYQELYNYSMNIQNSESIELNYTYDYLDNDKFLQIDIEKNSVINGKNEVKVIKYIYDIVNDTYEVKE